MDGMAGSAGTGESRRCDASISHDIAQAAVGRVVQSGACIYLGPQHITICLLVSSVPLLGPFFLPARYGSRIQHCLGNPF